MLESESEPESRKPKGTGIGTGIGIKEFGLGIGIGIRNLKSGHILIFKFFELAEHYVRHNEHQG